MRQGRQGLHGAAGIVLMLVALMCLFALDTLLGRLIGEPSTGRGGTVAAHRRRPG
jgi:hypothetical protein